MFYFTFSFFRFMYYIGGSSLAYKSFGFWVPKILIVMLKAKKRQGKAFFRFEVRLDSHFDQGEPYRVSINPNFNHSNSTFKE